MFAQLLEEELAGLQWHSTFKRSICFKIEGGKNSRSFDVRIEFKNQNGEIFSYDKTYTSLESRVSFLWKCENKGEVEVTVVYNKKNPREYYIKELKELEVSENSKIGLTIIGGLFILAGLCTIYVGIN